MKQKIETLYLNTMKKTLTFMLWQEPPKPITDFDLSHSPVKKFFVNIISRQLDRRGLVLAKKTSFSEYQRVEGAIWSNYAHTMIGIKRLDNLQYCIETVLKEKIRGDFIETGVWRGGACIFMRCVLAAYGVKDRKVFVADSFQGLPKPDVKYPLDIDDKGYTFSYLVVSKETVEDNFRKYGLLDDQVVFLEGWFKDSLPNAPVKELSILRLDGDLYESTMDALVNLYPKLSPGGFCIIDDYGLMMCREAVDDYRKIHGISDGMKEISSLSKSIYWRKNNE